MTTTLLGVDDSKTMRKVLEITFAGENYKTVLAANADDAMSKLQVERPSVMLVDAALEGTNGYELCQRAKSAAPGVFVILLSSKQQPYDKSRGAQVGADDFIDKPFDTQQLIDKVSSVLRRPQATAVAAPAVVAPPVAPAPMAARPAEVAAASAPRQRTQTLAYGSHPASQQGPAPVAPMIPAAGGMSGPRSSPGGTTSPFAPGVRPAPAPITLDSVPPPAATPAPAPVAAPASAAKPVVAPPASAAPATNGADFAPKAEFSQKLSGLGLTPEQVTAVLALSREVVEKVVWEVVPTLAETMIREEIQRLTRE